MVSIKLDGLEDFYTTTPLGVSLNTYNELEEIVDAFVQASVLYKAVFSDKKLDAQDLQHIGLVIDLVEKVRAAAKIENTLDLGTLTRSQVQDLLRKLLVGVFNVFNITPTGDSAASAKELQEIFDAFSQATRLFEKAAADGKLTFMGDVLGNAGELIDLTRAVEAAVKVNGVIDVGTLSKEQVSGLLSQVVSDVYTLVGSLRKLRG